MALPVPNLDDRTFEQLASEARALIPKNFPAWTDHNPSDPGITLLELFAFLVEALIYQTNRVPERSLEHFAGLVGVIRTPGEAIDQTLRRALESLSERRRAVTEDETENLALQADNTIARAKALAEVIDTPNVFPDDQIIRVVIVPNEPQNPAPVPTDALRQKVFEFLGAGRLITTHLQVVAPEYSDVRIVTTVARDASGRLSRDTVRQSVDLAVRSFLSPLAGGLDGKGWEFGRPVFRSELYQLIEGIAGVDHVQRLLINEDDADGALSLSSSTSLVNLAGLAVTVVDR